MDTESLKRFVKFLDLEKEPPTLDFLKRIVPIHLEQIPYESLSKILFVSEQTQFVTLTVPSRQLDGGLSGAILT